MFFIILRKIKKNKWIVLCLLLGLVLSVGIVSSIPMYSRSMFRRVLSIGLEDIKLKNTLYPGGYYLQEIRTALHKQFMGTDSEKRNTKESIIKRALSKVPKEKAAEINLPILAEKETIAAHEFEMRLCDGDKTIYQSRPAANLKGITGFEEHTNIQMGRLPSNSRNENGEYEVMVSEYAFNNLRLKLDARYKCFYKTEYYEGNPFYVRVVGVYTYKDENDPYWDSNMWYHPESLIMDFNLLISEAFRNEDIFIGEVGWYYAYDYKKINEKNFLDALEVYSLHKETSYTSGLEPSFTAYGPLYTFMTKMRDASIMLWILHSPILLMLLIYISMMSKLIIEADKNEIALLKSRGGGLLEIIPIYIFESLILGGIALITGPILGRFLCKIIGATDGFLTFVERQPLEVNLTVTEYAYSITAVMVFILTMMIPVYTASKKSIVEHKQSKFRYVKRPVWQRFYIDFVMLGMTAYGLYSQEARRRMFDFLPLSTSLPLDPFLYMTATFLIIGLGLLFLRVYPYLISFILWIGKRRWGPASYSTLVNISRSDGRNGFVMLFLIISICTGIFNVKVAGTLNKNLENNFMYSYGADVKITPPVDDKDVMSRTKYQDIAGLDGIEKITRVIREKVSLHYGGDKSYKTEMMSIMPHEFGEVAWFKDGLMPYHFNEYLNLLTREPKALLLSRAFEKAHGFKKGDTVNLSNERGETLVGYVGEFIDYWPSYNLHYDTSFVVVSNYQHSAGFVTTANYEAWIKAEPGDYGQAIYEDIRNKQLKYGELYDVQHELVKEKNNPMLQGINGALTLDFIAVIVITIIGFLIYWIMSIRERTLQFGILRSIGMSFGKILSALSLEQLLISGAAIGIGRLIGELNIMLFMPMLKLSSSITHRQTLPFKVEYMSGEYLNVYLIILLMLVIVSMIIARFISKINMGEAVKLGED